jgi:hypothetical protein
VHGKADHPFFFYRSRHGKPRRKEYPRRGKPKGKEWMDDPSISFTLLPYISPRKGFLFDVSQASSPPLYADIKFLEWYH